jgi:hypothetical protein
MAKVADGLPTVACHSFLATAPSLHAITENESPQDVPVALLILGAVAHQCHPAPSRELLHQAQRKLLAMVLNGSAALVDRAVKV